MKHSLGPRQAQFRSACRRLRSGMPRHERRAALRAPAERGAAGRCHGGYVAVLGPLGVAARGRPCALQAGSASSCSSYFNRRAFGVGAAYNWPIERTRPGKPGRASHVAR